MEGYDEDCCAKEDFFLSSRDRLCHLHHSSLHRLLLQHHHGLGLVLPTVVISAHPALDHMQQQLEHSQLQPLHVH